MLKQICIYDESKCIKYETIEYYVKELRKSIIRNLDSYKNTYDYYNLDSLYINKYELIKAFPEYKNMIKDNPKWFIKYFIKKIKDSDKLDTEVRVSKNICIIYNDIESHCLSFKLSLNKEKYKCFIIYLMKKYKLSPKIALSLYSNGIKTYGCSIDLKKLFGDSYDVILKLYSSTELEKIVDDIFYGFLTFRKEKNE